MQTTLETKMRLELLDGRTFDLDITPTKPFEEKCGGYTTSLHLSYYFNSLDARIVELSMAGKLADVQLWDCSRLEFRGDAIITLLRQDEYTYHFVLEAIAPYWHETMKVIKKSEQENK